MNVIIRKNENPNHIPVDEMTDNNCPKCGSDEIAGGFVETGDGIAVQKVSCNVCDAIWRNVYDFSAVELLDDDVVVEILREATTGDLEADAINTDECPYCGTRSIAEDDRGKIFDGSGYFDYKCYECKRTWTLAGTIDRVILDEVVVEQSVSE